MLTEEGLKEWFGAGSSAVPAAVVDQWGRYVADWAALTEEDKNVGQAEFWLLRQNKYPAFSIFGLWHAERAPGAIATERANAVERAMENKQRMTMQEPAWQAELSFRVNEWLVDMMSCAHMHVWEDRWSILCYRPLLYRLLNIALCSVLAGAQEGVEPCGRKVRQLLKKKID